MENARNNPANKTANRPEREISIGKSSSDTLSTHMGWVDRNISESSAEIFSDGTVGRPPVSSYSSEMIACPITQAPRTRPTGIGRVKSIGHASLWSSVFPAMRPTRA
ncbi:hypothetical protein NKI95_24570 [Mesorhizobium sp. M0306]|uniref:hypothetical protein n=1 Tax=unclassified Mesorhizobium TaxID=325217 RepID=UPI00333542E6